MVVLALPDPDHVLLIHQYRPALRTWILELPAGKLEPGERPRQGALRELAEETGHRARRMSRVLGFYPCPGLLDEYMHLYRATDLNPSRARPDSDEVIEVRSVSRSEARTLLSRGEVQDAKTLIGLQWWFAS